MTKTLFTLGTAAYLTLLGGCGNFGDGAKQLAGSTSDEVRINIDKAAMPLSRNGHNYIEDFLAGDTADEFDRSSSQEKYVGMSPEQDQWGNGINSEQVMGTNKMWDSIVDTVRAVGDDYDMHAPGAPAGFGSGYRD